MPYTVPKPINPIAMMGLSSRDELLVRIAEALELRLLQADGENEHSRNLHEAAVNFVNDKGND